MFQPSRHLQLALILGWQDLRQAYRRSALGQFWITAGMAVQIGAMGLVFGIIFRTPLEVYLPFLASSIIIWGFMSSTIVDGCMSFINSEGMIKQLNLPMFIHVFRSVWKQMLMFAHNIVILPIVFVIVSFGVNLNLVLFIPAVALLVVNLSWLAFLSAIVSARYRDIPQVISSIMTILYFVSPVMWQPNLIPAGAAHLLLGLNPMYHLLQIVRNPILGLPPTLENWILCCAFAVIGWTIVLILLRKTKKQIAYWV